MSGGPRERILHPTSPAALVLTLHLLLTGCASERVITQKGESGPIAWEVTDIRQSVEEHGNRMRWNYTLVLRNTGSTTITFDQMTRVTAAPSAGTLSGGYSVDPYARTLKPGAEIREAGSYSHGCSQNCDPQWVRQMLRTGVVRSIELRGRDDAGRTVTAVMRLRLDSSVGASATAPQSAPAPEVTRRVALREVGQIAGKWRGTLYGPGWPLATLTVERDGTYAWVNDRESGSGTLAVSGDGSIRFESSTGQRGTFTLYEDGGRRRLMIDYDTDSRQGRLAPLE